MDEQQERVTVDDLRRFAEDFADLGDPGATARAWRGSGNVGGVAQDGRMTSAQHHRIDYIEIPADDLEASKRFYGEVFGWEFNDYGPNYAGIKGPGDREVGGLNPEGNEHRGGGSLVLLFSDDLDATAAAVERAGGNILAGPYDFPGGRRFHFADPAGNELGVWAES